MKSPFPGMDPYLEHPTLWPDVPNRLIAAIADAVVPLVAPAYCVALERRAYLLKADDIVFVGRPDIAVVSDKTAVATATAPTFNGVMDVEVPMTDEVSQNYLEIHEVKSGRLVTIVELLSPTNKLHQEGREQYTQKRSQVLLSRTNLIEIDLLRAGEPMAIIGRPVHSDYRILVSRGWQRPRAQLYAFSLRRPIPQFSVPLLPHEAEPIVDLNSILHELYQRARFDLRLDYTQPPVPPFTAEDAEWAKTLPPAID